MPTTVERIKEETKKVEEEYLKTLQQPSDEQAQTQEPEPQTQEPETPQTQEPVKSDEELWEHKYNVLQGKYNAEVPRLHQELKQIREENNYLRGKLELLENIVAQKGQSAQPMAENEDPDIKQLKEDFPEVYKAVEKLLAKTTQQVATKDEVKATEEKVNKVVTMSFYDQLTNLVPDWQALNQDPEFLAWLSEVEPYTGKTKHELMLMAYNEGSASKVAQFFNNFKKLKTPPPQQPVNNLSSMVSPPKGRAQSAPVSNKPIFTEAQVTQFYVDKALGKIPKEDADRLDREIAMAFKEGRIRLGG